MAHVPITKRKKSHEPDIHKFQGKESFLTSQIELYVEEEKPKIPDGGWGWVVVLACFTLNTISEGVSFSFGLMYIEFLVEFEASKSATSWIGSLFLAIPLLAGPLGSALVDRYGCISMTCLGSIICTIGFVMSAYVRSIGLLYLTFGFIGGIGRCLTFVTAVVSIAFWFEKKRTVALGLAASGAGFGTILFAPLTTALLMEYHWRGTMLILGGFFFNMCVCGVTMRDPAWIVEEEREKKAVKKQAKKAMNGGPSSKIAEIKHSLKHGGNTQVLLQNVNTAADLTDKKRVRSNVDLPTYLKENEKIPVEVLKKMSENKKLYKIILENFPNLLKGRSSSEKDLHSSTETTNTRVPLKFSMKLKTTEEPILEADEEEENDGLNQTKITPLIRKDSAAKLPRNLSNTYLNQLKYRKQSVASSTGSRKDIFNIHKYKNTTSSCPNVYGNILSVETVEEEQKWYVEFFKSLKKLLDMSLFLEFHFFLLAVSTTILFVWFIVPYFYLAEHMTRLGYTDADASIALSVIGFTNTIGMVVLGWIGDRLNIAKTYSLCLLLCGVSIALIMFFAGNFWLLMINSGLFGLFFASCFSLLPSLLAELVPLEDFTMAYGLVLLCEGVGNLTGPPLAGFIFDLTGSWDQSFYQAGFWITICGLLVGIIPYTNNRKMLGTGPLLKEKRNQQSTYI